MVLFPDRKKVKQRGKELAYFNREAGFLEPPLDGIVF